MGHHQAANVYARGEVIDGCRCAVRHHAKLQNLPGPGAEAHEAVSAWNRGAAGDRKYQKTTDLLVLKLPFQRLLSAPCVDRCGRERSARNE